MVSIIIPAYKEEKIIGDTLRSMRENLGGENYELIVSDDRSPDRTEEISKQYADRVVEPEEGEPRSIPIGKNRGAKNARGEFLLFMDADVKIIASQKNLLTEALDYFRKDSRLIGLTARIKVLPELETAGDKFFFGLLNFFYYVMNNMLHIGSASGEFQMMRTEDFRKIGGFDEMLKAGEDNDLFRRLAKLGRTRIAREIVVFHSGRRAHKIGWSKLFLSWLVNGASVLLFKRSPFKEWSTVR